MPKTVFEIGERAGFLTIIAELPGRPRDPRQYMVRCDCGIEKAVRGDALQPVSKRNRRGTLRDSDGTLLTDIVAATGIPRRTLWVRYKRGNRGAELCRPLMRANRRRKVRNPLTALP
jgi:hypothetical protein